MFNRVKLYQYDTCYTYALKRTGRYDKYFNIDIEHIFNQYGVTVSNRCPVVGNIIFWDDGSGSEWYPNEISKDGIIIYHKWNTSLHFAVVEHGGMISDCTKEDTENVYPILRMRRLDDIKIKPKVIHFDCD